jgi:hypothetical protein
MGGLGHRFEVRVLAHRARAQAARRHRRSEHSQKRRRRNPHEACRIGSEPRFNEPASNTGERQLALDSCELGSAGPSSIAQRPAVPSRSVSASTCTTTWWRSAPTTSPAPCARKLSTIRPSASARGHTAPASAHQAFNPSVHQPRSQGVLVCGSENRTVVRRARRARFYARACSMPCAGT